MKVICKDDSESMKIEQQKDGDFKITYGNGSIDFIHKEFVLYFSKKYKVRITYA